MLQKMAETTGYQVRQGVNEKLSAEPHKIVIFVEFSVMLAVCFVTRPIFTASTY